MSSLLLLVAGFSFQHVSIHLVMITLVRYHYWVTDLYRCDFHYHLWAIKRVLRKLIPPLHAEKGRDSY